LSARWSRSSASSPITTPYARGWVPDFPGRITALRDAGGAARRSSKTLSSMFASTSALLQDTMFLRAGPPHLNPACVGALASSCEAGTHGPFPRCDTLLDPVKIVVLELVHQLVQWPSVVLEDPPWVAAHMAEEGAGLPDFQLEDMLQSGALAELNAHRRLHCKIELVLARVVWLLYRSRATISAGSPLGSASRH